MYTPSSTGIACNYHANLIVNLLQTRPLEQWLGAQLSLSCPHVERVMMHLPTINWHMICIASNPSVSKQAIVSRLAPDNYRKYISHRPDTTLTEVLESKDHPDWDWWFISKNPSIVTSFDVVLQHMDLPWHISGLMVHPHLSSDIRFLELLRESEANHKYPAAWSTAYLYSLGWKDITRKAPINYIREHRYLPWDSAISRERLADPPLPLHKNNLFYDNRISLIDIITKRVEPNDWRSVSLRDDVTFDVVAAHPNLPWDLDTLHRKYATPLDLQTRPSEWMPLLWEEVLRNLFAFSHEVQLFARQYMAVWKIQRAFRYAIYTPEMLLCQRRISRWASETIIRCPAEERQNGRVVQGTAEATAAGLEQCNRV